MKCPGCGAEVEDIKAHYEQEQLREAAYYRERRPAWVADAIARDNNPWRRFWRRINRWGRDA